MTDQVRGVVLRVMSLCWKRKGFTEAILANDENEQANRHVHVQQCGDALHQIR